MVYYDNASAFQRSARPVFPAVQISGVIYKGIIRIRVGVCERREGMF